jgi:hypothetical protein
VRSRRRAIALVLYGLFVIQYVALALVIKQVSERLVGASTYILLLIYPIPLVFGVILKKSIERAMNEGALNLHWGYICNDWATLMLISTYF